MNTRNMSATARLRETIATLENVDGKRPRSDHELSVLYAMRLVSIAVGEIDVDVRDVRAHAITKNMSQPTFNRALRSLVEHGDVCPAPSFKARYYRVCLDFTW